MSPARAALPHFAGAYRTGSGLYGGEQARVKCDRGVLVQAIAGVIVSRRERRPPDQILTAERACKAFTEGLTHAVGGEVIGHLRPRAIARRRRSAGEIDVMTADIPARGIGKQRGRAIGVGHALPARLGVIGNTGEAPLRRSAEWLMELSDQTTSSNP